MKKHYAIRVPTDLDDQFNFDVAIHDIEVLGMNAYLMEYDSYHSEYFIMITDKQMTILTLKGYKLIHRSN